MEAQLKLFKSEHCKYLLSTGVSKEHAPSQLSSSLAKALDMGWLVSESKHNYFRFCQNSFCLCYSLHLLAETIAEDLLGRVTRLIRPIKDLVEKGKNNKVTAQFG